MPPEVKCNYAVRMTIRPVGTMSITCPWDIQLTYDRVGIESYGAYYLSLIAVREYRIFKDTTFFEEVIEAARSMQMYISASTEQSKETILRSR